jgi:hypothetical protein
MSQIVSMELNLLHLTMGNKIVNNLYDTLIIIVYFSRGFNRKAKFTSKLADPDCFSTCFKDTMIFRLCNRQGDYILFLRQPHQWFIAKEKQIAISGLLIITFGSLVKVNEADQRI